MKTMQIGGKLRRLRQERRLTQTQMAQELGISPSYLNLIESNRRPVTVRVLVQLADKLRVEIASLASDDDERLSSELMEALSDPIFEEHDVKASDVRELVATPSQPRPRAAGALPFTSSSGRHRDQRRDPRCRVRAGG